MDYHPNLKDLPKLIKNHLPTVYESPHMRKVFSDDKVQIRTGFRRTKNLKDLLVPFSLPVADQETSINCSIIGCFRCHRQVCDACQSFSVHAKRIKSVTMGKTYKIRWSLSCRNDYVIYCATCTLCNRQCVGSSIDFRSRLSNHKSHIKKNKRTCWLVNHFIDNSCSHTLSNLKFILTEQVATKTEKFLEYREAIGKLSFGHMDLAVSMQKRIQFAETSRIFELISQFGPRFASACFIALEIKL